MFGNIKNFSYLNSWFAPVRQFNASKGYTALTHLFFVRLLQVSGDCQEKIHSVGARVGYEIDT
jgi:hypothetical protein